jgi:hypothetical protein
LAAVGNAGVTDVRPGQPPDVTRFALGAALLAALGLLLLWAVLVLWASSKSPTALPLLTVPGMFLGAAAFFACPAWSRR